MAAKVAIQKSTCKVHSGSGAAHSLVGVRGPRLGPQLGMAAMAVAQDSTCKVHSGSGAAHSLVGVGVPRLGARWSPVQSASGAAHSWSGDVSQGRWPSCAATSMNLHFATPSEKYTSVLKLRLKFVMWGSPVE